MRECTHIHAGTLRLAHAFISGGGGQLQQLRQTPGDLLLPAHCVNLTKNAIRFLQAFHVDNGYNRLSPFPITASPPEGKKQWCSETRCTRTRRGQAQMLGRGNDQPACPCTHWHRKGPIAHQRQNVPILGQCDSWISGTKARPLRLSHQVINSMQHLPTSDLRAITITLSFGIILRPFLRIVSP